MILITSETVYAVAIKVSIELTVHMIIRTSSLSEINEKLFIKLTPEGIKKNAR